MGLRKTIFTFGMVVITSFSLSACGAMKLQDFSIFDSSLHDPAPESGVPMLRGSWERDALASLGDLTRTSLGNAPGANYVHVGRVMNKTQSPELPMDGHEAVATAVMSIGEPLRYAKVPYLLENDLNRALYLKTAAGQRAMRAPTPEYAISGAIVAYDTGVYGQVYNQDASLAFDLGSGDADGGGSVTGAAKFSRIMVTLVLEDAVSGVALAQKQTEIYVKEAEGEQELSAYVLGSGAGMRTTVRRSSGAQGALQDLLSYTVLQLFSDYLGVDGDRILEDVALRQAITSNQTAYLSQLYARLRAMPRNALVMRIQQALNGSPRQNVAVDGLWGGETKNALQATLRTVPSLPLLSASDPPSADDMAKLYIAVVLSGIKGGQAERILTSIWVPSRRT